MHRNLVKDASDRIQEVQRLATKIGGRIHLAYYRAPDDEEVLAIPDDIVRAQETLERLRDMLDETLFGQYLIAMKHGKGYSLTAYEPMSYEEAAETAENLTLLGHQYDVQPYFYPISVADVHQNERWQARSTCERTNCRPAG